MLQNTDAPLTNVAHAEETRLEPLPKTIPFAVTVTKPLAEMGILGRIENEYALQHDCVVADESPKYTAFGGK